MAVGGPLHGTFVEVGSDPHAILTVRVQDSHQAEAPDDPYEYTLDAVNLLGRNFPVYLWAELEPQDLALRLAQAFLRPEFAGG